MDMTDKVRRSLTTGNEARVLSFPRLMQVWLDQGLSMALKTGGPMAVMLVRLDGYAELVSECCDEELNALMATLLSRLKKKLRQAGASIRPVDNGFTIIYPFNGDLLTLHGATKAMLQDLQQPILLDGHERRVTASIGIASYPEDGNSAELLLSRAHEALCRTDRYGGNGFCLYSRSAAKDVADQLERHEDLRRALGGAGSLSMRFQPILDLSRNCMDAVTGDIHWKRLAPDQEGNIGIASIAERAGLQSKLNEWIVDHVFRKLSDWHRAGIDRSVSIAVSRSQVTDGHLARLLADRLSGSSVFADSLEVSIDQEFLLVETDHRLQTGLRAFADLGIELSVSNVGRGALPFQSLQNLPFRSVCLAPSMVAAIGRCAQAEKTLKSIIGFMHDLDLDVRATDIRDQEQLDLLRSHGCGEASGPFFAPALNGDDIDRLTDFLPCLGRRQTVMLMPQQMSMH